MCFGINYLLHKIWLKKANLQEKVVIDTIIAIGKKIYG